MTYTRVCLNLPDDEFVFSGFSESAESPDLIKNMEIRLANTGDLPEILAIYAHARSFMAEHGNPNQWNDGYPEEELLIGDIENERLFLVMEGGIAAGVFMFFLWDEPTYQIIREGSWPNALPYGTIHRIASSGKFRGVFAAALGFCLERTGTIRIDTHRDNLPMQSCLLKHGFRRCGIIDVRNGERIAYQLTNTTAPY